MELACRPRRFPRSLRCYDPTALREAEGRYAEMTRHRARVAFLVVVAAIVAAFAVGRSTAAPETPFASSQPVLKTIVFNGQTRRYWLYRPPGLPAGPVPAELVLSQDAYPSPDAADFEASADQGKFVLAFPQFPNAFKDPSEVQFVGAVIDDLVAGASVDPRRVYVAGGSGGGFEAYRVACGPVGAKVAGVGGMFAGIIAPTAGQSGIQSVCRPTHPLAIVEVHGTQDGFVPYAGWSCRTSESGKPSCLPSQPDLMSFWAGVDRCPSTPSSSTSGPVTLSTWDNCANGTGVELVTVAGGGHDLTSLTIGGVTPPERIWSFLSTHAPQSTVAPVQLHARLVGATVAVVRGRRVVAVRVVVNLAASARVSLVRGSRTTVSHVARLGAGAGRLKLLLPVGASRGRYIVRVALTVKGNAHTVLTHSITVR